LKSFNPQKTEYRPRDLAQLADFVLKSEKTTGAVDLTLELTHAKRIRALNRRFRGVDRTTDVIAFRYPGEGGKETFAGDIAINIPQARLQAKKMRHPARREIRLL